MKNNNLLDILGKKIRELRTSRGLSQEKLAFLSGFDRTYISKLERGKINISILNLMRLTSTFQINLSELLSKIEMEIIINDNKKEKN